MKIIFEPSGTNLKREQLRIRLDFIPDESDKSYSQQHVYLPVFPSGGYPGLKDAEGTPLDLTAYKAWENALPYIWRVNPCLCLSVGIDENTTYKQLQDFAGDVLKDDVAATIDDIMAKTDSAHYIDVYARNKATLSSGRTTTLDAQKKSAINAKLKDFRDQKKPTDKIQLINPGSFYAGPGATDRAAYGGQGYTYLDHTTPCTGSGSLSTFECWLYSNNATEISMGTVRNTSGANYILRDYENLGVVTAGSKQTFTGKDCTAALNDLLAIRLPDAYIEVDTEGGSHYTTGFDFTDGIERTYATTGTRIQSTYATGTESATTSIPVIMHHRRQQGMS